MDTWARWARILIALFVSATVLALAGFDDAPRVAVGAPLKVDK